MENGETERNLIKTWKYNEERNDGTTRKVQREDETGNLRDEKNTTLGRRENNNMNESRKKAPAGRDRKGSNDVGGETWRVCRVRFWEMSRVQLRG